MRRLLIIVVALLVPLVIASGATAAGRLFAPSYGSGPPELIGGFQQSADGSLTPIAGSPFAAYSGPPFAVGGLIGVAFGPDGSSAAGAFIFGGGVQGLSVAANGAIAPANSIATRQSEGIAVAPDGRFAYEATRSYPPGTESEGILTFAIASNGTLTPSGSPIDVGISFGEVAITPNGRFLFAGTVGEIRRYAVNADGSLAYLGTTATSSAFRYLTTSPDSRLLFAGDTGGKGGVASLTIGADGSLTPSPGEQALTGGASVELFAVSPDGSHIYMPDEGQDKIVVAAVAPNGSLTVTGSIPVVDPNVAAVSPDGRFLYWVHNGPAEGIGVAAIAANGLPNVLPFNAPWKSSEPVRLVFQPGPAPVASFTAKAAAPGAATRFSAGSSTNAAIYNWDFGDGTTVANGGADPAHVYAKAGVYSVTLSLKDASGCGAAQVYTGQSTVCPGGTATTKTLSVDTLPALGKLKVAPKKFLPKGVDASAKGKRGASFKYTLSEKAGVSFKIERKLPGRVVGGKCKKKTAANAGKRKCPLFKRLGSRPDQGKAGANKFAFNGKFQGKPLTPGAYRVTAVATDSAKGRSAAARAPFKILPY